MANAAHTRPAPKPVEYASLPDGRAPVFKGNGHKHVVAFKRQIITTAAPQEQAVWRYAYDASQRRVLSQQGAAQQSDPVSNTQAMRFQPNAHRLSEATCNANGQPQRIGQREYVWDALGRLTEVREVREVQGEQHTTLARYRHDHRYTEREDGREVERCQRVNFRFMGLWDTVLSTHTGSYNLAIPSAFTHVAHAVALNEYRHLFPSESIMAGPYSSPAVSGQTRIERGFLGSHSDIGGSFADGDLAKVAMVWMVNQATAAGVTMDALTSEQTTIIASPVLHDKSSNLFSATGPAPTPISEDLVIRWRDGSSQRQRTTSINGVDYADDERYISYSQNPTGNVSGTVNMHEYLNWLDRSGYGVPMTVN